MKRRLGVEAKWQPTAALAVVMACFTTLFALTPVCLDDLAYLDYWRRACEGAGSEVFSIKAVAGLVDIVRFEENGRPGNVVCPLWLIWVPAWMRHLLLGAMTTGVVWGMAALASGRRPGWKLIVATWVAATFLLPWRARMFVTDYALNYIPATLLMIGWLWCFCYSRGRRCGKAGAVLMVVLGVATGMQHEGLCAVMTAAVGLYGVICRFRFEGRQWCLIAGFAAGMVMLLSGAGIWLKLGASTADYSLKSVVLGATAIVALAGVVAVCVAVPSLRSRVAGLQKNSVVAIGCLMALAGIAVDLKMGFSGARTTWFPQVASVIVIVMIARRIVTDQRWRQIVAGVGGLVTTAFYVCVIYWQWGYYEKYTDIDRALSQSASGTVYSDLDKRCPRLLLQIPLFSVWSEPTHIVAANLLYRDKLVAAVPTALRGFDRSRMKSVEGTAGAMDYEGVLLLPDRQLYRIDGHGKRVDSTVESARMNLRRADGHEYRDEDVHLIRFVAAAGDTLIWISPAHWRVRGPFDRADEGER